MHTEFLILSIVWVATLVPVAVYQWRQRNSRVGIVLTYLIFLTAAHFLQGLVYAFPWYEPLYDSGIVLRGYSVSLLALICFVLGSTLIAPSLSELNRSLKIRAGSIAGPLDPVPIPKSLPAIYIAIGMISYFILIPLLGNIPTISAFLSGTHRLYHIGLILAISRGSTGMVRKRRQQLAVLGLVTIAWPILTMARDGFLGFGLVPTALIAIYAAFKFGRARSLLVVGPIVAFLGLSVIITYFGERTLLRSVAWGGEDSETRFSTVFDIFANRLELFDPFNPNHLDAIDMRLALNRLAGLGIERLDSGIVPFAEGQTIGDAVLMMLPRAIWPDKPIVVGGQALVNQYTGVYMHGSTTVALGQVLEFYVNFGAIGIILGFTALGLVLTYLDVSIAHHLESKNLYRAALLIAPCFGLWLVEDNFITAVGSGVATLITVFIVNILLRVLFAAPRKPDPEAPSKLSRAGSTNHRHSVNVTSNVL